MWHRHDHYCHCYCNCHCHVLSQLLELLSLPILLPVPRYYHDYKDSSRSAGLTNFTVVANDRTKHSHTLSGVCSVSRCGHLCFFWCLPSACRRGGSEYMAAGNTATEAPRARAHPHLVLQARALAAIGAKADEDWYRTREAGRRKGQDRQTGGLGAAVAEARAYAT